MLALGIPKDQRPHLVRVAAAAPCFDIQQMSVGGGRARCLLVENRKVLTFCCQTVRTVIQEEVGVFTPKL